MSEARSWRWRPKPHSPWPGDAADGHAAAAVATLRVEQVPCARLGAHRAAWADLCARALESNVFLEPGFALLLLQTVAPRRRPHVLVVWEHRGLPQADRMIGLLPVACPRLWLIGQARGFHDKLVALGTPLLDRECGREAFVAMLEWMERRRPRPAALILTGIPADGAFMKCIVSHGDPSRRVAVLASHDRAALRRSDDTGGNVLSLSSAKTRKERKRKRRRLADHGATAYVSARTTEAVMRATETFLELEHRGWKGQRGTALLATSELATFTRSMTREMADEGKCRIDALEVNGQAVAMGIVLTSGDRAHFWKTAFDEALAPLSPGMQFTLDLAEVQLGDAGIALTDSCAVADHPMIDKLWLDRLKILDVAVALHLGDRASLSLSLAIERGRRRAWAWAKAIRVRLKNRALR